MNQEQTRKRYGIPQTGLGMALLYIAVSLLGLLYQIVLMRILGSRGMGYFAMASEVYRFLALIVSGALPLALAQVISEYMEKREYRNTLKIFKNTRIYAAAAGGLLALALFFFAGQLAWLIFDTGEVTLVLRAIAPVLLVTAFLSVYQGFFQGRDSMVPTAVSQLVGQGVCLFAGSICTLAMTGRSLSLGAAGGAMGIMLGEAAALAFCMVLYHWYKPNILKHAKHERSYSRISGSRAVGIVISQMIPLLLCQLVYRVDSILDASLYHKLLAYVGYPENVRVEMFGIYSGEYKVMLGILLAVSSAVNIALMPSVNSAYRKRKTETLTENIDFIVRLTMVVVIPCAVFMMVLAKPVIQMFFEDIGELPSRLLTVGAPLAVLYALSTVTNMILQNIRRRKAAAINSLVAVILHTAAVVPLLLMTEMNIYALVYGGYVFAFIACILNIWRLEKALNYKQEYAHTIVLPIIAALITGAAAWFFYHAVTVILHSNFVGVVISAVLSAVVYIIGSIIFSVFSEAEIRRFPYGERIIAICKKIHIL